MRQDLTFVFDFDGTIVDSLKAVFEIGNRIAPKYGFRQVKEEEIAILKGKGTREVLKAMKISVHKSPFVLAEIRRELSKDMEVLPAVEGIGKALRKLVKNGIRIGILTSNLEGNVKKFLKKNDLDFFDFIYSGSSHFGKDKVIRKMLKEKGFDPSRIIYVGDETRDIEACKKCGLRIAAVSWGFNSHEVLKNHGADWVIDRPNQLLNLVF
jgi:phosphoglycolate phosphatase